MNKAVARLGKTILKIYAMHLLTFTVGAFLGAFECLLILHSLGWGPR